MKNGEGYKDPTAGEAIGNVTREERSKVIHYDMKNCCVKCPTCGHRLNKVIKFNIRYCPWCGQKMN
ncbi:MAG: hypothetical protein PUG60_10445 [Lachnospiraceae bacterium]|nr:hypothetical protein [Lachnospiraceae bacterium]MDY4968764.1 hypothetical protein [Lachnospiraceae bacterium]